MSARDEVLARLRAAAVPPAAPPPHGYRTHGDLAPGDPALLDLLVDRLEDYGAQVLRCPAGQLPATVAGALTEHRVHRLVRSRGVPADWLSQSAVEQVVDDSSAPLGLEVLDGVDAVLTGCAVAVADTGTIVLDGAPEQGRRALSLVPDLHLCLVRSDQVVQTVPEALPRLDPTRPLTWVSGPSATSDIELSRVEGVHGPRTLVVVLVTPEQEAEQPGLAPDPVLP